MNIQNVIDALENSGYGIMFVDIANARMVPYDVFTEKEMEEITALYAVKMTQEIFENGLSSLDGVDYLRVEVCKYEEAQSNSRSTQWEQKLWIFSRSKSIRGKN